VALVIIVIGLSLPAYGQLGTAVEYFCPPLHLKKKYFFTPDSSGRRSGLTTEITYTWKNEGFEIETVSKLDGSPGLYEKRTYVPGSRDVRIVSIAIINLQGDYFQDYDEPEVIFMLPSKAPTTWFVESNVQKTDYNSEWTSVVIDGKVREAVKVTERYTFPDGRVFGARVISYYVKGIGLWKKEGEADGEKATILQFDRIE
jgi:hypothetical protein